MYLIHLHNLSDPEQGTNTKEYNVMVSLEIKFNKVLPYLVAVIYKISL